MKKQTKTMDDTENSTRLCIHLSGGIPAFRELDVVVSFFEPHLVWAGVALLHERREELMGGRQSYSLSEKWYKEYEAIERERLQPILDSYRGFLREKYFGVVTEAIAVNKYGKYAEQDDSRLHRGREGLEEWFNRGFSSRRMIATGEADADDVNSWISHELGTRLCPTIELSTSKSLEVVIDISMIAAMVAFQEAPLAKDIIKYAIGRLKEIVSRTSKPAARKATPMKITPAQIAFFSTYDEVDFEYDGATDSYRVSLRRTEKPNKAVNPSGG